MFGCQGHMMRSRKVTKALVILMAATLTVGETRAVSNSCVNDELEIFSCSLQNRKMVSLCKRAVAEGAFLVYRYGKPAQIELEFAGDASKTGPFFYAGLRQRFASYFEIGFKNRGYQYLLVKKWGDGESLSYHLLVDEVDKENGRHLDLRCVSDIVDNGLSDETNGSCDPRAVVGCSYADRR